MQSVLFKMHQWGQSIVKALYSALRIYFFFAHESTIIIAHTGQVDHVIEV